MLDLSRLSALQRQAVLAPDGPLLILAGPGSGKTLVLAAKIACMATWRHIPPASILAVTFAAKAAHELRSRLLCLLGEHGAAIDVSTFHALGLRIVRQWSHELDMGSGSLMVYGEGEVRTVLREVATTLQLDLDRYPLHELHLQVERVRRGSETGALEDKAIQAVAEAYETILRRRGAVDYPAMLGLPLQLFNQHPDALRVCQDRYRFVLCDEFQDICGNQYSLLRCLTEQHHNLIVVGDPLQTLYGWRGADTRFLNEFQRDFPEATIIGLHQNFRSTCRIVDLANALGAPLLGGGTLWTDNPSGDAIRFHVAGDERAEAAFVVNEIERLVADRIVDRLDDVAILYRTNWQALPFELALLERLLPYDTTGRAVGERSERDPDFSLVDRQPDEDAASETRDTVGIRLSTIHRAKGGEWGVVFVVGMEEGLMPHARAVANQTSQQANIDEERRVAYVAVTRARERLYLTCCRTRRRGDRIVTREPSRFLRDLPFQRVRRIA